MNTILQAGTVINEIYRLEKPLGKGGMGEVWLARHLVMNEPRAIKLVLGDYAANPVMRQRFIEGEARTALRLERHPHIIRFYELGLYGDSPFIVMEYVEAGPDGATLKEMLEKRGSLSLEEAGAVLEQVASALDAAHRQGIIHRDIKPGNILIAGAGERGSGIREWKSATGKTADPSQPVPVNSPPLLVKLSDFGLTKDIERGASLTSTGYWVGTVEYIAPEQAQGVPEKRSDIYALGVVLYEMLTGRLPFLGVGAPVLVQHAVALPSPPQNFKADLPATIGEITLKALAKKPEGRYNSAGEMAAAYWQALEEWQTRESLKTEALTPVPAKPYSPLPISVPAPLPASPPSPAPTPLARPVSEQKASSTHNLPAQLTTFVGREKELAQVKQMLQTSRLLTLTGAGGMGKSRLALQAARESRQNFADGAWLVELASLSNPALLGQAVASVLGVREEANRPLLTTLIHYLEDKRLLLVLDNCEHVIEACAHLVQGLLRACPTLTILVSSQESLAIEGETNWRVPSLSLPPVIDPSDSQPPLNLEILAQYEAIKLFLDRALMVQSNFTLTAQNAPALIQICQQLDGIPLALELAAARVKALTLDQIAARLDNRFRLLTGGNRTALPRQQTLRALVDWSYELLADEERVMLRRLSVFAGGWLLDAAETICVGDYPGGEVEDYEVVDHLQQLVNKSLVVAEEQGRETRYRLLETIRQYAGEKLEESGETVILKNKHALCYLALAEEAEPQLRGPQQSFWLSRLYQEHPNLRAALAWKLSQKSEVDILTPGVKGEKRTSNDGGATDPSDFSLRLCAAIWRFWFVRGYYTEGRGWLDAALASPPNEDTSAARVARTVALRGAGLLARMQSDYAEAIAYFEESLKLCQELGDKPGIADAFNGLGSLATYQSDYAHATALLEESLSLFRELNNKWGTANSLNSLGGMALMQGEFERAHRFLEESLEIRRELGDKQGIAHTLNNLGGLAEEQGDYAKAIILLEESVAIKRELGNKTGVAFSLLGLGDLARVQGHYEQAAPFYQECLVLFEEVGDKRGVAGALYSLGVVASSKTAYDEAIGLYQKSLSLFQEVGDKRSVAGTLHGLGRVARMQGHYEQALKLHKESLKLLNELGGSRNVAECLEGLAAVAAHQQQPEKVARLCGAAEALREITRRPIEPGNRAEYEQILALAQPQLDPSIFTSAWAEGHALSLSEAIQYALNGGSI